MSQSEQVNEIAKALAKAQGQIKGAVKGKENEYFHSTYADLAAVMDACRTALAENGIAVVQATEFSAEGNLPLIMWLETRLVHSSGQWMSGRYPIQPIKADPQGYGSATTYARRYGLMAMVGIVAADEDDDGEGAMGRNTGTKSVPPTSKQAPPKPAEALENAKKWADQAIKKLATFKKGAEFDKWHDQPCRDRIAKLKDYDAALHASVLAAMDKTLDRLNPIGGG